MSDKEPANKGEYKKMNTRIKGHSTWDTLPTKQKIIIPDDIGTKPTPSWIDDKIVFPVWKDDNIPNEKREKPKKKLSKNKELIVKDDSIISVVRKQKFNF
jgi:hypothetical protein